MLLSTGDKVVWIFVDSDTKVQERCVIAARKLELIQRKTSINTAEQIDG